MPDAFQVFAGFLVSFLPFFFVQRWIHREIQTIFLLLTRNAPVSMGLFSLLFLPGVLLHEVSHLVTAKLLGVRTGQFSVVPQVMGDGHMRLGYVETEQADLVREALIGAAPLLAGGAAMVYLGMRNLGVLALSNVVAQQAWGQLLPALHEMPRQPDFWVWFYLAFTISSTMLPSRSDRKAWIPIGGSFLGMFAVALLAGAGGWMGVYLLPLMRAALVALTTVFGISLFVHLVLALPIWLVRSGITRLTGLEVVA